MRNDFSYNGFDFRYDVYPMVFETNKEVTITVSRDGGFDGNYTVTVFPVGEGHPYYFHSRKNNMEAAATVVDGKLQIKHTFDKEMEYMLLLKKDGATEKQVSVYAVEKDLIGRYPFIGDLHVHSTRSDGGQTVPQVVAGYRKNGYDFFALTDHERYYPSLEGIEFAKKCGTDMVLFPGEEVHLGVTDVHIVHFGGEKSINAYNKNGAQCREAGETDYSKTHEELCQYADEIAETLDVPEGVEKRDVGAVKWICDRIREVGGISIYAHPFWRRPEYHIPFSLNEHILERHDFDAYELIGGEIYFEMNGLQVLQYHELRAKGIDFPVVGSSDSHNVTGMERNALIARTLVLSPSLEWSDLKEAILSKEHYSIPVDLRPLDYGVIAPMRLALYASFLIGNYFPIHDKLCLAEGEAMEKCIDGTEGDFEYSKSLSGGNKGLLEKYFAF